ncbi:uncharacterized protein BJ171DRAFT_597475 [Polychytrium aggregatum]|uniref:uncharacterized protein n=1 Tax=Polychytrium aggregatum TaxID=110093 RepID=UPI0022FEF6AD|nr:uncharacterized protein BJ171DRAFT_597475 [Polychytrium aggregatum]KAI9206305.1 hypothetical protein BJ171DRAFT_597475 [Polychytrium aggregatum]
MEWVYVKGIQRLPYGLVRKTFHSISIPSQEIADISFPEMTLFSGNDIDDLAAGDADAMERLSDESIRESLDPFDVDPLHSVHLLAEGEALDVLCGLGDVGLESLTPIYLNTPQTRTIYAKYLADSPDPNHQSQSASILASPEIVAFLEDQTRQIDEARKLEEARRIAEEARAVEEDRRTSRFHLSVKTSSKKPHDLLKKLFH